MLILLNEAGLQLRNPLSGLLCPFALLSILSNLEAG